MIYKLTSYAAFVTVSMILSNFNAEQNSVQYQGNMRVDRISSDSCRNLIQDEQRYAYLVTYVQVSPIITGYNRCQTPFERGTTRYA